ncbi:MAG: hypothetical protein IJZ45_03600 [Bacteroidaceae bacterium]|nr:hypothetical protein [Bacteroidaceae bacterium]
MKLLYRFIAIMVVALLTSCSTTEKFLVSGTPNTKIYTPAYEHVGTVGSDGTAQIELTSDYYYAYLLSKDADSDAYIPFALDYKYKSRAGAQFLKWTGISITATGLYVELMGAIMYGAGLEEDVTMPMVAGGAVGALAGMSFGWPASERMDQTAYEYQFKYLSKQSTNSDLHFTKVAFTEPHKNAGQVNHDISTSPIVEETSVSKKQLTEKSAKTLKNYGKQVANTYVGTGKLTQNKTTIESYSNIKVKVEYVNKDEVRVNVTESNGSDFFADYSLYKVEKRTDGSYLLTHSKIASATITIDINGNLKYNHPKVNIDGEVYNLQITTTK